jgi:hypothetical protein
MNLHSAYSLLVPSALAGLVLATAHCGGTVVVAGETGGSVSSSAATGPAGPSVSSAQSGPSATVGSGVVTSGGGPCNAPSGGLPSAACTPTALECKTSASLCLSLIDNTSAPTFGLRVADLDITAPAAFKKGLVKGVIQNAVTLNHPQCNLNGGGTLSWLLQLDTAAGTLRTGGARPNEEPNTGYSFDDEVFPQGQGVSFHAQPVTVPAALDPGCAMSSKEADLNLPVFLDLKGSSSFLLPFRQVRFDMAQLSSDHNCIGQFNAALLDPAGGCLADDMHPAFVHAGQISAYFSLEEADTVVIDPIGQTLCVLLSGDAATFGDGGVPTQKCKRDAMGGIVFKGDWCAAQGQPATPECHDGIRFKASFAASGVQITN